MSDTKGTNELKSILVTGDVTIDHYIYEGERDSSRKLDARGVSSVKEVGGAAYILKILKSLMELAAITKIEYEKENEKRKLNNEKLIEINPIAEQWKISAGQLSKTNCQVSYSIWKPFAYENKKSVYRISNKLGFGDQSTSGSDEKIFESLKKDEDIKSKTKILIIDDAGYNFRTKSEKDNWNLSDDLDWIILKMSRPLALGDLWQELITKYSEKLIVIVSANELRSEDIRITQSTSWEQIVEDTKDALYNNYTATKLTKAKHLVISFNNDGALWINNFDRANTVVNLLCDTSRTEYEWSEKIKGEAFGYMSCLTAAVVYFIIYRTYDSKKVDLVSGIEAGLSAMRNLLELGHGLVDKDQIPIGFPSERIASEIRKPKHKLATIPIPWKLETNSDKNKWMIAEMMQRSPAVKEEVPLTGLSSQVVYYGTKILNTIPHANFTKLTTADRNEIETLRRFKQIMLDYKNDENKKKPISFGVFGPPGAGKSFGVKQIASEVFEGNCWLEYNLSQFSVGSLAELYGAFHQVRDKILSGVVPIVFIDEFDSKEYAWLQYLLAPMQDGEFQEGQLRHSIGRCIFIFAGATSHSYESFGKFTKDDVGRKLEREFILKKGPDFKSRLDAYMNVLGPNQKLLNPETDELDPSDTTFHLRRAIFISTKIKYKKDSYLPVKIDAGLVNALLRIPKYTHGARSLDKLLSILQSKDGSTLERAKLPADPQLNLYVDAIKFNELLNEPRNVLNDIPLDDLAAAIFASFLSFDERTKLKASTDFGERFDILDDEAKEDNRAAARRMIEILSSINLKIEKINETKALKQKEKEAIQGHIKFHLELLSTLEHNGWWMQRLKADWKFKDIPERIVKEKVSPLLIPYSDLPNYEKEKDRKSIMNYPTQLENVGYQINWIK
jgi:hypothetical protein